MSNHRIKTSEFEEFLSDVHTRAFEIYQERIAKGVPGDSMSDWFQAEKEMKKKHNIK